MKMLRHCYLFFLSLSFLLILPHIFPQTQAYADTSWNIVNPPPTDGTTNGDTLYSVARISSNDIWAVGWSGFHTLTKHWNGTTWSVITSPNVGNSQLLGVVAVSTNDVWAVGTKTTNDYHDPQTLVEHWDGTSWSVVDSPNPAAYANSLEAVTVVSANNIWAVGNKMEFSTSSDPRQFAHHQTLIEHWDGTSWSEVTSPNGPNSGDQSTLTGVTALSPTDIWAAGSYACGSFQTLTMHYDGTSWSVVTSPNVGTTNCLQYNPAIDSYITGINAISSTDVWAVGSSRQQSSGNTNSLTLHYDGTSWNIVDSPNVPNKQTFLRGISALSTQDVWAIGNAYDSITGAQSLTMHYDGTNWTVVPSANVGNNTTLFGVSAVSLTDIWAVGENDSGSIMEHYTQNSPTQITSTFDILTNGYSFANEGFIPTWSIFESTFGTAQVDFSSGQHNPIAEQYYNDTYVPALLGGNCFGVSATSLLFYTGNGNQTLLSQNNTTIVHGLPDPTTNSITNFIYEIWNQKLNLPPQWNSTSVSQYIAKYQGWVASKEFQTSVQSQSQNVTDVYNTVKQDLQQGFRNPPIIGMTDINSNVGHAVVPYKIEDDAGGIAKLFVYDPNFPCKLGSPCQPLNQNDPDPSNRYIKIDRSVNPVTWEFVFDPNTNRVWENPQIYIVPMSSVNQSPTLPISESNGMYLVDTGLVDLYVTNNSGNAIGYQNGSFVNTLPGANVIIPPLDSATRSIPSYALPSGAYSIQVQGKQSEHDNVDIFGPNTLLQVANLPVATGSGDTISTDNTHRSMTITTQDARKTYNANLYVEPTTTNTKEFDLTGLTIAQGEQEKIAMTSDSQSVEITNNAQTQNIHLTTKQVGSNDGTLTVGQPIIINTGDRIIITPTNWNNLSASGIMIQTDQGNTGTFQTSYRDLTRATLSPTENSDGTYQNPVTVNLSATASGVSIGHIYYKIDAGSQQIYSSPFTVSGVGSHTVTYWSVDNEGLTEVQNTKTFTIAAAIIAHDNFQRANQTHWGTASDGNVWGSDASSNSTFSISANAGQVVNTGGTTYSAILGAAAADTEVLFTGKISSFTNDPNIGAVSRFTDSNNWYKAYIDGDNLVIQKKVQGTTTTLNTTAFIAAANTLYTIKFQVIGTTLQARVWRAGQTEPTTWQATAIDTSLSSGNTGLRILTRDATATITNFIANDLSANPTPTPTPNNSISQDTFTRANQSHWGIASDGHTWGGDANTSSAFSINSNSGKVISNGTSYSAILGATATNAQVLFSGSLSSFASSNLGSILRWTDTNNWYKAYIDGSNIILQKKVSGTATILKTVSFSAAAGINYTVRFQVVGTNLSAKVWKTTDIEPTSWTATVTDTSLASGYCGLRMLTQNSISASYTSFKATSL